MGQRKGLDMIGSRRWGVVIGWVLLVAAVYRVVVLIAPLRDNPLNEGVGMPISLFAIMGLIILPIWIMFAAHQLGYIRGATNDLTPPEQAIVSDYKIRVEIKKRNLTERVNRWTDYSADYPSDKDGSNPRDSSARG